MYEPSLEQIVLLYYIYELDIINQIKSKRMIESERLFREFKEYYKKVSNFLKPQLLEMLAKLEKIKNENQWELLKLDFNSFPHLHPVFLSLPETIQKIVRQYVLFPGETVKLSQNSAGRS
jgi:hypothetical protein